ncbi:PAS domain-containing hybrid sensor histidine kinase/response regulator [Pseudoteredinibacter isoporae]|uniref:histidine kinase n=1 Tax=Pseudoteredinibacter isoporae TaxID=570281 RepID=A0A7X0JV90_9GAMM|nr:PAS domain-containing hybrid sensor histidine kinase/response regulator [Pseudoteredinibacter isoporae]MBB6522434.1 Na+/proline symporter/signal transduction histidine kinase/CheY-like chemotaxis protein [Pseudoteredinibacter isoporae]NHO87964.1 hybrid sensor histidine kinase/response regulator [Pseudoteredinibacter isoporae]NIB23705.1 hybrid sensor histidine kinase/response regulator [Pseudoteredinibacter isoporae]
MIDQPFLLLIALIYVGLLFLVAWWADQSQQWYNRYRPMLFALALGVYCSSWTFYGAVGQSMENMWSHLPIYLGPILVFLLGYRFLRKLLRVGEYHKVTSIADFIGSRYGKSQWLSALVAILAIVGSLPYIALQLRAVSMAWEVLGSHGPSAQLNIDTALITALLMGLFAVLFGTRHLEGRERNRGVMAAVALESIVKLVAFVVVAMAAVSILLVQMEDRSWPQLMQSAGMGSSPGMAGFITQTLLAAIAIVCLPRQFHMAVVEYQEPRDLRKARFIAPLYVGLFALLVVPIVLAGHLLGSEAAGDTLVLSLPSSQGYTAVSILAFIGGFSAATGMVIVAAVTLAVMISNELVAPLWLRINRDRSLSVTSLSNHLRLIRRLSIFALLILSWLVHKAISSMEGLAPIGLLSFAAAAQFAPALIAGLYWRKAHRLGVLIGLVAGYSLWLYCLVLPALAPEHNIVQSGLWGLQWLRPQHLFGSEGWDPLAHGVFWSLGFNVLSFLLVSTFSKLSQREAQQARLFIEDLTEESVGEPLALTEVHMGQVQSLLEPLVGRERMQEYWRLFEHRSGQRLMVDDFAPQFVLQEVEGVMASILGAATAQRSMKLLSRDRPLKLQDFAELVDNASQQLRFNQDLLQTTVETVSQGISVVDADLRLVAWNEHYAKLFDYPERTLYIGCPVENLYRINAERGMYGDDPSNREQDIARRLDLLRHGSAHRFERQLPNGIVVDVRGTPMPNGGFVTTYTDISDFKAVVSALEETTAGLEQRVAQRTQELSISNEELAEENKRRAVAEQRLWEQHNDKTRFLAHTSHDLLQPINAARLFAASVQEKLQLRRWHEVAEDIANIDSALASAEDLIGALREISKLDAGELTAKKEAFALDDLLQPLAAEFAVEAGRAGLDFHYQACSAWVSSDAHLLRRILQNFLSNALRYTERGKVMLGCRRRPDGIEIQIWDTGPGIEPHEQRRIFEEFVRLGGSRKKADKGLGLGLAISKRSADILEHPIILQSATGKGTVFSILVPQTVAQSQKLPANANTQAGADLSQARILCVDNEESILQGMRGLLETWGCTVWGAGDIETAQEIYLLEQPDFIIADYHLDNEETGIQLIDRLADLEEADQDELSGIVISADNSETLKDAATSRGFYYLSKPVKPAALRSLIRRLCRKKLHGNSADSVRA